MPTLENPLPQIAEAADAATKIASLQMKLFMLNQEVKAMRQLKRAVWIGVGLLLFNLLITLTAYWVEMDLYERGWSALSLAWMSLFIFGLLAALTALIAIRVGEAPKTNERSSWSP